MRMMRGLAALLALLAGLVGLPWLLAVLTMALAPTLAAWSNPAALLSGSDPVAVLLTLLLVGAWVAWLVFLLGVLSESLALVSRNRITVRLPGLDSVQRLAAGLLISVIAMVTTAQASSADPPRTASDTAMSGTAMSSTASERSTIRAAAQSAAQGSPTVAEEATRSAPVADSAHVHVVERGDDLWSLAQDYYGSGSDWRRIAAANPDRLTGRADRLQAGWQLIIPGVAKAETQASSNDEDRRRDRTVVVRRDDTLSAIAEREYGAQRRWPIIWNANRHQLDDPDELTIGMRLVVPYRERWDGERATDEKDTDEKDTDGKGDKDTTAAEAKNESRDRSAPSPTVAEPASKSAAGPTCADDGTAPSPRSAPSPSGASATPAAPVPADPVPVEPAPVEPVPPDPAPIDPAPPNNPPPEQPPGATISSVDPAVVAAGVGSAGALLAAAVITGLALRRRQQLQARPVGRRILHPSDAVQRIETALGHRARPLGLRTLDLATRAISAHCHHTAAALPALTVAVVSDERLELRWTAPPATPPPAGFRVAADQWVLDAADVDALKSVAGLSEAVRPYPALVTVGLDGQANPIVVDLEALGLLHLDSDDPTVIQAVLTAMALELSFSPWAEEMILTSVGALGHLPEALGRHNVTHTEDVGALLTRLESRAAVQREQLADQRPGQPRVDPDLADPWAPEIMLFSQPLEPDQERRLHRLLTAEPRVTMAAVVPRSANTSPRWTLRLGPGGSRAAFEPLGLELTPQLIEAPAAAAVVELVRVTGAEQTTPAPWWSSTALDEAAADPDPPPDNVSYLELTPRRFGGWAETAQRGEPTDREARKMIRGLGEGARVAALHPTLLILGPVELIGATGSMPPRAAKQCLEYCGWLLEHPGATAQAMASALVVAEGTRRSNMSRLRSWLGHDEEGTPYLPDAYSGRIVLEDTVSSDWQRLQILTAHGIDRASTTSLRTALDLVRGAPLADAAPGQWHWAEELRTDMISAVRDLGVELARRALDDRDIDLARWAASRALAAAPGDELLLVTRIRTEHQAGHRGEVERLTLHVAAQARQLGVDLAPETVTVLQQVMEGRVRARLA